MKLLEKVKKVPGGTMVIPLLIGATINTFCPWILKIGSFTTAVFSNEGSASLVGLSLVFIGSQLRVREAPEALKRGSVLLLAKFIAGGGFGFLVAKIFGVSGFLGLSVLAITSCIASGNGGLYTALVTDYGEPTDVAALSILNIKDGPFLTMLALGATGVAHIPIMSLIAAITPLFVGIVLGNIDKDIQEFLKPGIAIIIPCFAFALGAGISFKSIVQAGFTGILLGLLCVVISSFVCILFDRIINRRPGYAGAATSAASGNSVATPAAVALVDKAWQPYVAIATAQVAAAVVVTAIVVPFVTSWVAQKWGNEQNKDTQTGQFNIATGEKKLE
ncbi:2-keto-3-deoxygluconate permease [Clostridium tyrobutyricum]|uniref:2-keto-3-deoxygluconate permease n=1 Tax=Clostridium tyrobutyricum TaxID=1519 RepID=UPI00030AE2C4|nr:2-keto-3-deoxygluconate permease [Clostridium tyrobutyricum]MEA5009817.1 2-keto-3-deoxygluconate permease [Clostridium tyrobutyricum]